MKKIVFISIFITFLSSFSLAVGHAIPKESKISWMTGWQFNMNPAEAQSDGWNIMSGAACLKHLFTSVELFVHHLL